MSAAPSRESPPIHEAVKPLEWLIGKWRSENGQGIYPTLKDFKYKEELEFFHVGQPNVQFNWYSYHPHTDSPSHREVGFIRAKPGTNKVAINAAHNTGLAEVEEGEMGDTELRLTSHTVGRLSFGKPPQTKQISRVFTRIDDNTLRQVVCMETSNTAMTQHLDITYQRVQSTM